MGSDETAMATTGGPRVIDVFDGNGAPSAQIAHFFRGQVGSWRPHGVGLVVGSRLHRMRRFLGQSKDSEAIARLFMVQWADLLREIGQK